MIEKKTTLLIILDGWGHAENGYPPEKNAIHLAHTPFWDSMLKDWSHTLIHTSGNWVGLPEGVMGNSEVGHLNLGAGRIIWQEITRIDKAIEKDGLRSNQILVDAMSRALESGKRIHLMGLVSDGGVHSVDRHYIALLRLAKNLGLQPDQVVMHCFMDGRDTPPQKGAEYIRTLQKIMDDENLGTIATVSGRYYAMDRDKRWERTGKAYRALVFGETEHVAESAEQAMIDAYSRGENDEFVVPTRIVNPSRGAIDPIQTGDEILFFNFRPDRARQLSHAFVDDTFDFFPRKEGLSVRLTTLTRYETNLKADVAFPPKEITGTLGEIVSNAGMTQLRIAETEKYAHVTYFFSGGREEPFPGEDRILVPSPKVATYDLQPEMSLPVVAEKLESAIRSRQYDLIVANFANGDMVGHTGVLEAAIKAAEAVDKALARVLPALLDNGGEAIVTADHGNCENMWNFEENCPHTQHTTTPTQMILVSERYRHSDLCKNGKLGDVTPTLLDLMKLKAMTSDLAGKSLLCENQ